MDEKYFYNQLHLTFKPEFYKRIKAAAKIQGVSMSEFVKYAVQIMLNDLEKSKKEVQ
jgi:predicted HicB family RNase H-like nuclease